MRFMPLESRYRKLSRNIKFTQIQYRELGQPKAGKMTKISQSAGKLPTMAIRRTTFAHRVFPILTMRSQKAYLSILEEGNFIYDKVLSVCQEHIQADRNLRWKTRKNHPECRNQPNFPTFGSCSFLHKSQNCAWSVPLESK